MLFIKLHRQSLHRVFDKILGHLPCINMYQVHALFSDQGTKFFYLLKMGLSYLLYFLLQFYFSFFHFFFVLVVLIYSLFQLPKHTRYKLWNSIFLAALLAFY